MKAKMKNWSLTRKVNMFLLGVTTVCIVGCYVVELLK